MMQYLGYGCNWIKLNFEQTFDNKKIQNMIILNHLKIWKHFSNCTHGYDRKLILVLKILLNYRT